MSFSEDFLVRFQIRAQLTLFPTSSETFAADASLVNIINDASEPVSAY
jgi:hypothetical protein